ncbi:SDR family NAD(P)-dependent oxidoreductase [Ancylobacter sp. WKF20]|uniref:SDR family NAD(P)-dependent oxidoreductase n=1 Tax=Ancylobacter sp. WKF20 TaxID=3039801 RepID=UPI0024342812|nr:SDR family NAD(P)-dependent oxidoreductase [Ancylobacter sp. WKF20]WGD28373.1 SDR family NAD(P)-dependent oxidoreductase [Ancylobacter sp. WKF20]
MANPKLSVLILGAASGIAQATARLYAAEGAALVLTGRHKERLDQIGADLTVRGASSATSVELDFLAVDPRSAWQELWAQHGPFDHILIAYGVLGDHARAEKEPGAAQDILAVNFTSAAAWSLLIAEELERRGKGSLVVLGSVAGDRGRRANYIYGAAKAGLATLIQGIAHRFADKGPRAVIVKPGPTDTPMTAGMTKGGPLWATPEQVAKVVRRAADAGGPVQYAPARWRLIMLIIGFIPSRIFNKMNL